VVYFNVARRHFAELAERRHKNGIQSLQEAREWAEWRAKDREKRLPKLTKQEEEQMKNYLRNIEQHGGVNRAPIMSNRNAKNSSTVAMKESDSS
jgi:hypothetical protein